VLSAAQEPNESVYTHGDMYDTDKQNNPQSLRCYLWQESQTTSPVRPRAPPLAKGNHRRPIILSGTIRPFRSETGAVGELLEALERRLRHRLRWAYICNPLCLLSAATYAIQGLYGTKLRRTFATISTRPSRERSHLRDETVLGGRKALLSILAGGTPSYLLVEH